MNSKMRFSFKQLQIDKATTTMVIFIAGATALCIFSLFASRALLSQRTYQAKLISRKEVAKKQLAANIAAKDSLVESYQQFVSLPQNVIGGSPTGQGQNDGDNARIILDALPSKYDFPALTTSLEKLVSTPGLGLRVESIGGIDDEIAQGQAVVDNPAPVEMPFQLEVSGQYTSIQQLVNIFERSVRPFDIQSMSFNGTDASLRFSMTAKTYYQPEKKVNIKLENVK